VQQLALELLRPDEIRAVLRTPKTVRIERGGLPFDVDFDASSGLIAVTVRAVAARARPPLERKITGAIASIPIEQRVPPPSVDSSALARGAREPEPKPAPKPSADGPGTRAPATAGSPLGTVAPTGPRAIDELLHHMMANHSSDLHLSPGVHPAMRVHGEMHFMTERSVLASGDIEALVFPLMDAKARREFEETHDADLAYEIPGLARFRLNVFADRKGTGAVLRQIPFEIITAQKLGLSPAILGLCGLTKGLVLVTGPTGSGKSTTLAAMIDHVNKTRADHIITIEDPVEFVHANLKCLVNQREVGTHTQSFKRALRAALREDPDIVLVGEMRDLETVAIAIETAETGHLVFGTLHTTTAVSTVDRIIDQFPSDRQAQIRVMLSESLKGVVAQILCKRIGGGRVAAMEVLLVTNAVSSLIREGKTFQIPSVMQTSRGIGMVTLNDSLFMLVQNKLVTPEEAMSKAVDKTGLTQAFKNANIALRA
jgi:twitching motility protein PilT